VEVRHDERVANHIDPEPCVVARKGEGEASAGEFTGQPLSRVRIGFRVPTPLRRRKATRWDAQARVSQRPDVVVEPGMWRSSLRGNRARLPPSGEPKMCARALMPPRSLLLAGSCLGSVACPTSCRLHGTALLRPTSAPTFHRGTLPPLAFFAALRAASVPAGYSFAAMLHCTITVRPVGGLGFCTVLPPEKYS